MKLRNKKTGEIGLLNYISSNDGSILIQDINATNNWEFIANYHSLAELNEEWEDYEEPKGYWYLLGRGEVCCIEDEDTDFDNRRKEIGNYFKTREEAEKAVKKLKAWKRLKDIGFHFLGWDSTYKGDNVDFYLDWINSDSKEQLTKDLDLLFGGEE